MLGSRNDIIGDLHRLHLQLAGTHREVAELQKRLERVAAVAIASGKSYEMVSTATNLPVAHIHQALSRHARNLVSIAAAEGYELSEDTSHQTD